MREYYTEAFFARVLKSNINDKANAQRIHPPHYLLKCDPVLMSKTREIVFAKIRKIIFLMKVKKKMCALIKQIIRILF